MLRITTKFATDEPCLVLEGRLIGDWVAELEAAVDGQAKPLHLDLSHVRFVDSHGLALLQRLRSQGAVFQAVSPFVSALLNTRSP